MLATDGVIRWQGQPVGKLVAGEEVLKPRVRIIADEQLTGAPRDSVQARLDLWLKAHIEKLLGPLFQLANAEDVTGIARGVAFQLAEALGVLERGKVADDVKSLDQPARATLRKYGVRFGAYHIYVPALLKPAPRVLATQLYALKHDGPETKGLEAIQQLAAAGRTSIAADKDDRRATSIASPAIGSAASARCASTSWSGSPTSSARRSPGAPGAPGPKPAAAVDGFGFMVTTGDDVARRLLGRGFRLGPARARLSHGEAAEAAGGAGARAGCRAADATRRPKRRRLTRQRPDVASTRRDAPASTPTRPNRRPMPPRPKPPSTEAPVDRCRRGRRRADRSPMRRPKPAPVARAGRAEPAAEPLPLRRRAAAEAAGAEATADAAAAAEPSEPAADSREPPRQPSPPSRR